MPCSVHVWPTCRTIHSLRFWAQPSDWSEQWSNTYCFTFEKVQSRTYLWSPRYYSWCVGGGWMIGRRTGWRHHCFCRIERQVLAHSGFLSLKHGKLWCIFLSLAYKHREIDSEKSQQKKSSRDSGSVHCSQLENENILSEQRNLQGYIEGKLIKLSKENVQLRQNYLKHSLKWTDENGRCRVLTELFMNLASSFNSTGWNSIKRINQRISPKGKRVGYAPNWKWGTEVLKKIARKGNQEIDELKKMCFLEAERARQLSIDDFSIQGGESQSTVNQLPVQIKRQKWMLWTFPENSMILKRQAVLGYPSSQSAYEYSESSWNAQPRFLPAACYTELIWFVRTRFWRSTCSRWTISSFLWNFKKSGISTMRARVSEHRKTWNPSGWTGKKYSTFCNNYTESCNEVLNLESLFSCKRSLSGKLNGWVTEEMVWRRHGRSSSSQTKVLGTWSSSWCKHNTHLARMRTRKIFLVRLAQVWRDSKCLDCSIFCARHLKTNLHTARMPCSEHYLIHLSRHLHRAPRRPLPCCSLQIEHQPLLRCSADLPNTHLSQLSVKGCHEIASSTTRRCQRAENTVVSRSSCAKRTSSRRRWRQGGVSGLLRVERTLRTRKHG